MPDRPSHSAMDTLPGPGDEAVALFFAEQTQGGGLRGSTVDALLSRSLGQLANFLPKAPRRCSLSVFRKLIASARLIQNLADACSQLATESDRKLTTEEAKLILEHVKATAFVSALTAGHKNNGSSVVIPDPYILEHELLCAQDNKEHVELETLLENILEACGLHRRDGSA